MFRFSVLLAFALCFAGCKDLETKKVSSEVLAEEELKAINMNEVDEYPSFATCDSIEDQEARYQCFKTELALNFQRQLSNKTIIVESELNDTFTPTSVISAALYGMASIPSNVYAHQSEKVDALAPCSFKRSATL